MTRAARTILKREALEVLRDPVLCGWITGAAVLSYVLTYAVGGTRSGYWPRITLLVVPLLLIFAASSRRAAVERDQELRLFASEPHDPRDVGQAFVLGTLLQLSWYYVLVLPQILLYTLVVTDQPLRMGLSLAASVLLIVMIALRSRLLANVSPRRARLSDAATFAFTFVCAMAVVLLDAVETPILWLLALTPGGAAAYATGSVVDVQASQVAAMGVLVGWCALLLFRVLPPKAKARHAGTAAALLVVAIMAAATASSVTPVDSRKALLLNSEFAFDVLDSEGARLTKSTNLPMGEPTMVQLTVWGDRPTTSASVITFHAENATVRPASLTLPAGQQRYAIEVEITPRPGGTPVDEKHLVTMRWSWEGRELVGFFLVESEHSVFKPTLRIATLLPLGVLLAYTARAWGARKADAAVT